MFNNLSKMLFFPVQHSFLFSLAQPNADFEQNGSLYNDIYYSTPICD